MYISRNVPCIWLNSWSLVTHLCVSRIIIIGSDNGLSPGRCQAISGTNTGMLLIWPFGTKFSGMFIDIYMFLAATKQLNEWYFPSVCLSARPSDCPSVRHTFLTMFPSSDHHEIFRSYYQWQKWCPCKRSRSEVKGQGHRGHDPI